MVGRFLWHKLVLIFTVLYSLSAFSSELDIAYDRLKDLKENYDIIGTVCEQVARLQLEKDFPEPEYEIETGISYELGGKILGELDIVVFKKSPDTLPKAVIAYEVKCCRNPEKALRKARKQLSRFKNFLQFKSSLDFVWGHKLKFHLSSGQFDESLTLQSISYKGSGFDLDIDFSFEELMELRSKLMLFQMNKKHDLNRPF